MPQDMQACRNSVQLRLIRCLASVKGSLLELAEGSETLTQYHYMMLWCGSTSLASSSAGVVTPKLDRLCSAA